MKKIKLQYGSDERNVTVALSATVANMLQDRSNRAMLGYGDNVKALINGVEQAMASVPADGSTLVIETIANQKAN